MSRNTSLRNQTILIYYPTSVFLDGSFSPVFLLSCQCALRLSGIKSAFLPFYLSYEGWHFFHECHANSVGVT
jgi:hypothetical protein